MKNKLIRTPLPPFETFNDDPLRVLRLIRFSSRLDFTIVDEVKQAMGDPEIKVCLPANSCPSWKLTCVHEEGASHEDIP